MKNVFENISNSGLTIYDPVKIGHPDLWFTNEELEQILNEGLRGLSLDSLPIRTRSRVVKEKVCEVLGYPIPKSFKKTQPRFIGQGFDTYVQKSNNLQIWNEEVSPSRRYVLIRVTDDVISKVKVVSGEELAKLDTTGTLTQKYQARLIPGSDTFELVSPNDTDHLKKYVRETPSLQLANCSPVDYPNSNTLLSIETIFNRLKTLVGLHFPDIGSDQERNRGAELHRLVCQHLGYSDYKDHGQFPDVRHQLLEVKLQTSPTIDLGLVSPNSSDNLNLPGELTIKNSDVRYALFNAQINNGNVQITHLFLVTGEKFFERFPQFQGKVVNKKLQIPLPRDFFER
ncbi:restriction endonuclease [Brevibacillus sp. SKDU10]|uniref:hypothetical protein n=1 Tax=Brevibacillus sp. SKDU10 TaxID=1247872 RepID=UPI0007C93975|nr:hypothetical protein [Brevibacillus sp. SKDU10]OAJ74711.1 restriction endonuclease [Brevibacillus sp. SKDU10]